MGKRFQLGQLWLHKGQGAAAWYLRYRDSSGRRRLEVLGTAEMLPTKAAARTAAAAFLGPLNAGAPRREPATVGELLARYRREELPERRSTRAAYSSLLARWIEPRWAAAKVAEVKAADVEVWLRGLALATKTKANLRQLMHMIFECGRRWEMALENPIALVRQSAKRTRGLAKLSIAQYQTLCQTLVEPHRTMALIAGCLGLRIGEILGLRWGDVDWDAATLSIERDIYQGHVDEVKSGRSERVMPLAPMILESLRTWRQNAAYQAECEFIFSQDNGRPMWADTLRERTLQPVAASLGLPKIGWHAFRHLFAAVLDAVGAEGVVAMELMGHADRRTTEEYQYGFDDRKRAAAERVAAMLGPGTVQ